MAKSNRCPFCGVTVLGDALFLHMDNCDSNPDNKGPAEVTYVDFDREK